MDIKEYQKEVDDWFKEKEWDYWKPHEIIARLYEEGGELARLINHIYGPKKKRADELEQDLKQEMGDVIYTLICLANTHDIDLNDAIRSSIDVVTNRDKERYSKD